MYIGKEPIVGNFQKCDALTASGTADYTLQVSSTNVVPESANHMLVSLNGILQAPITSFTVSGSTLSFASALTSSDSIDFVMLLGNVLDIGTPSDATVTNAKLAQDIISGETALAVAPAATDEFLVSDAGVLKRVDASLVGRGKVLQVITATDTTSRTTTSTSFVTASNTLSVDITPSATSSKIFIIINTTMLGADVYYTIYRDSTNLGPSVGFGGVSSASARCAGAISVVDSPSSTSEITYQLYARVASGTAYINVDNNKGSITAMEISA
jgi:hypothetical protein